MEDLSPQLMNWLTSRLGSQAVIKRVDRLEGSTSSDLFSLQVREPSGESRLVLRLLTNREWLKTEPDLADHEASALNLAGKSGLPVPEVVAIDADGSNAVRPRF
ncbi:hypothetical protein EG832_03345 [bacterium]|nr:hypothetical protein [bacterium]